MLIPDWLTDAQGTALHFPFHLGHYAIAERAGLRAGETLLVHAGAGGVGSASIQLGKALGATVIATAGGPEKVEFCKELGADVAIDYREVDFAQVVLDETGGAGVDVCFDGVGGDVMMQSLRCLGRGGRHLVVGFASGIEAEEVPMVSGRTLCFGNFDILGVILGYHDPDIVNDDPGAGPWVPVPRVNSPTAEIGRQVNADLMTLLEAGKIRPIVGRTVAFEELPQALDDMEARTTIGRVVVAR
jgi:NADPH2:quinone reductase